MKTIVRPTKDKHNIMSQKKPPRRRRPDPVIQEKIFVPQEEDWELYETIRISREEHLTEQRRLHEEQARREQLRHDLALPLSRIRTWMRFSRDEHERWMLENILEMVDAYLRQDTFDIHTIQQDLCLFVEQHLTAPLYRDVVAICMPLLR